MNIGAFFAGLAKAIEGNLEGVADLWAAQPLVVTTLVTLLIDLAISFGAPISSDQKTILVGIVSAVGVFIAHKNVTPINKPSLVDGTIVTITNPAPEVPDKQVVLSNPA